MDRQALTACMCAPPFVRWETAPLVLVSMVETLECITPVASPVRDLGFGRRGISWMAMTLPILLSGMDLGTDPRI